MSNSTLNQCIFTTLSKVFFIPILHVFSDTVAFCQALFVELAEFQNNFFPGFLRWQISMDSGRKAHVGFAFSSRILNVVGS